MIFTELQVRNLLSESGFYDRNPEVSKYWAQELAKELTKITEQPELQRAQTALEHEARKENVHE